MRYPVLMQYVCDIERSLSGQPWRWRGNGADARDPGFRPDDLLTQLMLARGCSRETLEANLNPSITGFLPDPAIFRDMTRAAERLADAVEKQQRVTVFGDYDVDGATSAALLIRFLGQLGLTADAYIPDRLMEGYGPSGEALVRLGQQGSDLVVTVDCGAMAYDALSEAKAAGVEVIVVDHHKCGAELPQALALVNPNRLDECDEAASHGHLAAVGVAFLLAVEIRRSSAQRGYFKTCPRAAAARSARSGGAGHRGRCRSAQGIEPRFRGTGAEGHGRTQQCRAQRADRRQPPQPCAHLQRSGLCAWPAHQRRRARRRSPTLGVRLLTTEDPNEARDIAQTLDVLNEERRAIEGAVQTAAEEMLPGQHNRSVALLAGEGWHPGVIGIVAGRIKEKTGKPAIVIAIDADGIGKGSGRSVSGVDLGAAIIAARDQGLLVAGGGHAMAAGLTIKADQVAALADFLDERLAGDIARAGDERAMMIDALLSPRGLNPRTCRRRGTRRTLWHGLARAARGGRAGANREMRYRGQWPCPGHRAGR